MPIINQVVKGSGGGGSGTSQPNLKKQILGGTLYCDGNELIDLTGVSKISTRALSYAYYGTDITPSVSITNPTVVDSYGMEYMFNQSHFVDPDVDISGISTVNSYGCQNMFANSDIESVDISGITSIDSNSLRYMFYSCSHLISVKMFNIRNITASNALQYMFAENSSLPSIDLSCIEVMNGLQLAGYMLSGCSSLTNVDVSYIRTLSGSGVVNNMFNGSGITRISWDSLQSVSSFGSSNSTYIYANCTSLLEIHFPANMQSIIESMSGYSAKWGASNATIYFDLPSSYTLTGADGNNYVRNPHYDTADALAWFDVNVGRTTPLYTRGTTDPAASDWLFGDSDCTTPETTIDSIA